MDNFRLAVKSFIVNEQGELLLIRRRATDPHAAGQWEIPGGRLESGEDPVAGLQRETKEETGLDIEVKNPLGVHHFTRDDGQRITMITFLCRPSASSVTLSHEHTEHQWIPVPESLNHLHPSFQKEISLLVEMFL